MFMASLPLHCCLDLTGTTEVVMIRINSAQTFVAFSADAAPIQAENIAPFG
jgi:hypothetical protein